MSIQQTISRTRNTNLADVLIGHAIQQNRAKKAARLEREGRTQSEYKFSRVEAMTDALTGFGRTNPEWSGAWNALMRAVGFGEIAPIDAAIAIRDGDRATLLAVKGVGTRTVGKLFTQR